MVDVHDVLEIADRPELRKTEGDDYPYFLYHFLRDYPTASARVLVVRKESALNETLALFKSSIEKTFDFEFKHHPIVRLEDSENASDVAAVSYMITAWNLPAWQVVDTPSVI